MEEYRLAWHKRMQPLRRRFIGNGVIAVVVTAIVFAAPGCSIWPPRPKPIPPPDIGGALTQQELVTAINRNTAAAGLIESNVRVTLDGMPAGLSGSMVFHSPNKLRLNASLAGLPGSGVDIGSNDREFWIWNKSSFGGSEPSIYFARHQEYASSQISQQLRIEPGWVIDSLGLIHIDETMQVEGPYPRPDGRIELRLKEQGLSGMTTRSLVIEPRTGVIVQQAVYDSNNQRMVWANSRDYQHVQEFNVNLPRHLEIHAFDAQGQEMILNVYIKNYSGFYGDASRIWQMPMPADVPVYDLSKASFQQAAMPMPSQPIRSADIAAPPTKPPFKGFDLLKR